MKKYFSTSNILFIILMIIAIVMFVNPNAKATLIKGLMKIGLFQPELPNQLHHHENFALLPNIGFKDHEGYTVSSSDLNNRIVFVNFWATWCPPCIAEMPSLNKLYQKYQHNPKVVFIMVDVDNDYPKAKAFMDAHHYNLPLFALTNQVPDSLMNGTIPTTLIFNKDGSLLFKHTGAADYGNKKFDDFIDIAISK